MLTKEQRQKWMNRLCDARSRQKVQGWYDRENNSDNVDTTAQNMKDNKLPMCCLTHLASIILTKDELAERLRFSTFQEWSREILGDDTAALFMSMNDSRDMTLVQIAMALPLLPTSD